jgi:FKBP-type peptidyl-prolyl cis-trans isomerase FkpA
MRNLFYLISCIVFFASCDDPARLTGGPVYNVEANMAIDRVKIDTYLANTAIDSLYRIHDPSGVIIIVQEEGEGTRPVSNTVVYTDYIGSLLDGSVFDTSFEAVARENDIFQTSREYTPLVFTIPAPGVAGNTIQGFNFGFRRLRPGSKAVLIIPSPLAYRDDVRDKIPTNSILRFDVDFLGID